MNKVRALFRCDTVSTSRHAYGEQTSIRMYPVTGSASDEHKAFWDATPSGRLEIEIANEAALAFFEPGQEYYLDFTPRLPQGDDD